eukprot:752168-Hanusia_phi.AAC.1
MDELVKDFSQLSCSSTNRTMSDNSSESGVQEQRIDVGSAAEAQEAQPSERIMLLVLCGIPGSGKSTLAERLRKTGWTIICQDTLGSRDACIDAAETALGDKRRVVIDRTNVSSHDDISQTLALCLLTKLCQIDENQRAHWVRLARQRGLSKNQVAVMMFQVSPDVCCDRVMSRRDHPTLGPNKKSLGDQYAQNMHHEIVCRNCAKICRAVSSPAGAGEPRPRPPSDRTQVAGEPGSDGRGPCESPLGPIRWPGPRPSGSPTRTCTERGLRDQYRTVPESQAVRRSDVRSDPRPGDMIRRACHTVFKASHRAGGLISVSHRAGRVSLSGRDRACIIASRSPVRLRSSSLLSNQGQ